MAETKSGKAASRFRAVWLLLGVLCLLVVLSAARKASRRSREAAAPEGPAMTVVRVASGEATPGVVLDIASQPLGATVLLNGRVLGATPVHVEGLPPGSYCVRLERTGCRSCSRSVVLGAAGLSLDEKLEALPTGVLAVEVKPVGAEVLLDGELIGNAPLKASGIPVGAYELLIRKTNFDPYSARIAVAAGETLSFSGFELKDKIYAMMDGLVKGEPQRVAHYLDLGHYLFVNDRMDEAADVFAQGREVMQAPLDFNGPGYSGRDRMSAEERALEERLRQEDVSRFMKELEKHRNWPRKDTRAFRQRLEEAERLLSQRNVSSWPWVEAAAKMHLQGRGYSVDKAVQLYRDHLNTVGRDAPSAPQACVALMEAYLMQRDVTKAREVFDKFYAICQNNAAALLSCGSALPPYHDRMVTRGRVQVLEMAEQALRRGLELTKDEAGRVPGLFDLATVLSYAGRSQEAVPLFEQCIAATADAALKEERSLRLADALRRAERIEEADALYSKLRNSQRADIRDKANTGLIYVAADRTRLHARKAGK